MMNTENLYLRNIANSTTKEYETKKSMFDMSKNRTTLIYNKIEMVLRTTFICSSTCRKAEHVEQPELNLINAFIPSNGIEQNHKSFYLLYYSWYNNPSAWSEEDDASLINLAMKCPHFEGAVIYHARSFYNLIHPDQYNFIGDACDPVGAYKSAPVVNNQTGFTKFDVILYPNPTTSKLNLICNHCDNSTELIIHDAIGHQVWNQQLKYKNGEKTLEFNLPSGIYTITITNKTTKENETKKLIVE